MEGGKKSQKVEGHGVMRATEFSVVARSEGYGSAGEQSFNRAMQRRWRRMKKFTHRESVNTGAIEVSSSF